MTFDAIADEIKIDPGPHLVYGFATAAPNPIVKPIHPKGHTGDSFDEAAVAAKKALRENNTSDSE